MPRRLIRGKLWRDEVAVDRDAADEVAVVMEDAAVVMDTALALGDAHGSVTVKPLITPGGPSWSWCGQQPPDSRGPCVHVPPAQVEDQVNIVPTGVDIINFVPEDGTNLVDIFPESNHEEKVHLLQR